MAQKQLSPVLQTRKINSLPEDLRKIADELLYEKFGADDTIEEVKVEKSTDTFRGINDGFFQFDGRQDVAFNESYVDYRRMERRPEVTARCNPYDSTRVATTPICTPDFRGLVEALRRLDEQNLPRRDRIFRLEPRFWNYLKRDDEIALHLCHRTYEDFTIMGCRIIVDPTQCNELEVRF